ERTDKELIDVVVAMKQRNPTWGCRRIAQQISLAFARRYRQRRCTQDSCSAFSAKDGFIGSILAYIPWPYEGQFMERRSVSLWISHITNALGSGGHGSIQRRIIGFGIHRGIVDGTARCRMFQQATIWRKSSPEYLSTDNNPLFRFHQCQA